MIKPDKLFCAFDFSGNEDTLTLSEEESRHAVRVLRLTNGDRLHLINGRGGLFEAELIVPDPKGCVLQILNREFDYGKRPFRLHIAIAPTKMNERTEWFLEKAAEIGIDEITPIICGRSERKEVKIERLNKILIAAIKQSVKACLPKLNEAVSFKKFMTNENIQGQKFIAYCFDDERVLLQDAYEKGSDATVLIGPEGDFTPEEVNVAREQGFIPVSLGNSRLRTETAGVVACHTVNLING